jgi:hypothetical protein
MTGERRKKTSPRFAISLIQMRRIFNDFHPHLEAKLRLINRAHVAYL